MKNPNNSSTHATKIYIGNLPRIIVDCKKKVATKFQRLNPSPSLQAPFPNIGKISEKFLFARIRRKTTIPNLISSKIHFRLSRIHRKSHQVIANITILYFRLDNINCSSLFYEQEYLIWLNFVV